MWRRKVVRLVKFVLFHHKAEYQEIEARSVPSIFYEVLPYFLNQIQNIIAHNLIDLRLAIIAFCQRFRNNG